MIITISYIDCFDIVNDITLEVIKETNRSIHCKSIDGISKYRLEKATQLLYRDGVYVADGCLWYIKEVI